MTNPVDLKYDRSFRARRGAYLRKRRVRFGPRALVGVILAGAGVVFAVPNFFFDCSGAGWRCLVGAVVSQCDMTAIEPGTTISVSDRVAVNCRREPGHKGKTGWQDDTVFEVPPGSKLQVVGPSTTRDRLTWWPVTIGGVDCWMAESSQRGETLLKRVCR